MTSYTVVGGRPLRGTVRVPGDKSISHRALILGALAEGTSIVRGLSDGDDVARTRTALAAMGAGFDGEKIAGGRSRLHEPADVLDMGNSGTGIRLLAGVSAGLPWLTVLTGDGSIRRRPMSRVAEPLRMMGARVDGRDDGRLPPLVVRGAALRGIDYDLPVPSAQVKSAVLLAGLAAEGETVVRQPVVTRAHTEEMLVACGAGVEVSDDGLVVTLRPSTLQPFELDVPGDPSQAAFWIVAACIVPGSDVVVEDVYMGPARTGFLDVLARMGADVERVGDRTIRARYSPDLHGTSVVPAEIAGLIDEIPVLAVAAVVAEGGTVFHDVAELQVKESDRVATIIESLATMGAPAYYSDEGLHVSGGATLHGGLVHSQWDHRMAMAMAIAGLVAEGTTEIEGWGAVATSYPGFERDLEALCGS